MRECEGAWRFGLSVREYRELEAGERSPTFETWDRICKLYGRLSSGRAKLSSWSRRCCSSVWSSGGGGE
jgi:hypothetical protein